MITPKVGTRPISKSLFSLVTIEMPQAKVWASDRQREQSLSKIQDLLARCILPDFDAILPAQDHTGKKLFWIVAHTNQKGADSIARRIREQLSCSEELKLAGVSCSVSTESLHLDAIQDEWPLERQVHTFALCLEKLLKTEAR